MKDVAVVIPIYNGAADLPELIACLRSQTYPADQVEYFLVDNNSRDRTWELLQAAVAENPELSLQVFSENKIQSSYAARNTGIRAAKTQLIAFTDADCRPQPNWLRSLMQPFEEATVGIVVGEIAALPGQTLLEKYADREQTLSQKHTLAHPFSPYGQTANLAVRRIAFEQVGLFRPYLRTGGDADLCWRILQQTSWRLEFAPTAIVQHRHRSTLRELHKQWQRYGESNRYLHELYGVDLMREPSGYEYCYRLTRWLLKEVPMATLKAIAHQGNLLDFVSTPIGLFNMRSRALGQHQSRLSEAAQQIERL